MEKYKHIRVFRQRLHEIKLVQETYVCNSAVKGALQDVAEKLSRATEALDELNEIAAEINGLSEDAPSMSAEVLEGVCDWISKGIDLSRKLSRLSRVLDVTRLITEGQRFTMIYHVIILILQEQTIVNSSDDPRSTSRSLKYSLFDSPVFPSSSKVIVIIHCVTKTKASEAFGIIVSNSDNECSSEVSRIVLEDGKPFS